MVVEFAPQVTDANNVMLITSHLMVNVLPFVHLEQLWSLENVNLAQLIAKIALLLTLATHA